MLNFVLFYIGLVIRGDLCLVVVMDNCNIYYFDVVIEVIRFRGVIVIFLS